jgi:hypothetical protein
MCLDKVNNYLNNTSGTGYKVFVRKFSAGRTRRLFGENYQHDEFPEGYKVGYRLTATDRMSASGKLQSLYDGKIYEPGFHIFTSVKSAIRYARGFGYGAEVHQVRYSNAFVKGTQDGLNVIVAGNIKIGKLVWKGAIEYSR